jgi:DNA primase
MSQYYPDRLLRTLRNNIPIDRLITETLRLQLRQKEPLLRFRCPVCHSFHTATHPKTNLARCFDCQKNFNPIDMVMATTQCDFVDAVELLKKNFQALI